MSAAGPSLKRSRCRPGSSSTASTLPKSTYTFARRSCTMAYRPRRRANNSASGTRMKHPTKVAMKAMVKLMALFPHLQVGFMRALEQAEADVAGEGLERGATAILQLLQLRGETQERLDL